MGTFMKDNAGNRLTVVHAGSKDGFVPNAYLVFKASCATGDYQGQMNNENLEKSLEKNCCLTSLLILSW